MPFISIIIPTYNNEEHIEQAIDSCFNSDFDDFEVIVINDASTDKTRKIIEKLAKDNPKKITLIHSNENNGLGESRNIGIKKANSEFIMFLDGDDWLEPNSIKTIEEILKEQKPEVLMFNHQRVWPNNVKKANIPNKYVELTEKDEDLSEPDARKKSIKNLHVAWNKIYKRQFIQKSNIKFTKGYYEDIYFSMNAFTQAKTIFYTGKILINYRQREGSITKKFSENHFDIFKQYEKTITKLAQNRHYLSEYLPLIIEYCSSQIYGIYNTKMRIPPHLETKYLELAEANINKWKKLLI